MKRFGGYGIREAGMAGPAGRGWYLLLLLLLLPGGCATIPGRQVGENVAPMLVDHELPEQELLNVSIRVFDPGTLPEDGDERIGLSTGIREAEARFFPIHLKYTMQRSGYWGSVRVVPDDDVGCELLVRGRIEYSDGESCAIAIEAVDARNRVWFSRTYAETVEHPDRQRTEPEKHDLYQDLFNTIANDLALFRSHLTPIQVQEIREVARLRFAAAMAPEPFASYLATGEDGRIRIVRLPARDDPMLARVGAIRARDDMLVDAVNGYYDGYYRDLWEPYTNWRIFRGQEVAAMHRLKRQALTRQILGIASIIGAIAIGVAGDADTRARTSTLRDVMVMGGAAAVYSGYQKAKESEINRDAIEELGSSFSAEAEPLVMEVEGETVRLTGSAEQQYRRWRQLLRQIYVRETGIGEQAPDAKQVEAPSRECLRYRGR
ncbi:hypothetical protein ACLG6S_07395 [Thermodesulfobacteriota bacterium B35]